MGQSTYNTTVSQMGASNHWPLTDGAVTSFSDAIGSATLTASTAPATATGPDGSATGAYINNVTNAVLTAASFSWPEDWTMAWWQNCDATMTGDLMAWEWNQSAFAKYVQLDAGPSGSNMTLSLYYGTPGAGGTVWSAAKSSFGTSSWKFCTVSYKRSTNTLTLYIDGSSVGSQTTSNTQNSGAPGSGYLGIGGRNNAGTRSLAFDGALNGVALFASVLTSTQVGTLKQAMTGPVKTFTADMVVSPPQSAKTFTADMDISSNRTTKTFTADLTISRVSVTADSFLEAGGSDVSITSHTPSGPAATGTWSNHPSSGQPSTVAASSGRYSYQSVGTSFDLNSTSPSTADYEVEVTATVMAAANSCAVLARWNTSTLNGYQLGIDGSAGTLVMGKYVSGTYTQLGSAYTIGTLAGPYRLRLRCSGSQISGWLDGVQRITVTDTSLSAAGNPGTRNTGTGASSGFRLSAFGVYTGFTNTSTASFTADMAIVDRAKTKTFTADMVVRGAATKTFTADMVVFTSSQYTYRPVTGRTVVADSTATGHQFNGFPGFCVTPAGTYLVNLDVSDTEVSGPDYGTIIRRSTDRGTTWSTAKTFSLIGGDCSMFCVGTTIYAAWINANPGTPPITVGTTYNNYWSKSTDDGVTWSTPAILDAGAVPIRDSSGVGRYSAAASPGLLAQDGTGKILLPIYRRNSTSASDLDFYVEVREYATDFASGALRGTPFPYISGWRFEEPCITYRSDGVLLCAARVTEPNGAPSIWMNSSSDHGTTWGTAQRVIGTGSASTYGFGGRANFWATPDGPIVILLRVMALTGSATWASGCTAYASSRDGYTWSSPLDIITGTTVSTTQAGPGGSSSSAMSVYGAWATTGGAGAASNVAVVYSVETATNVGQVYLQPLALDPPRSATFTADMVIASSTATQTTKTFTASLQVVIIGAVKTFTASMVINPAVIPATSTYARPFTAALDVQSVTAPLDVQAVTAPLDMTTEAT